MKLYNAYVDGDADLVEINPLILTPDGKVHALDAKVSLDDNARVPPSRVGRVHRHSRSSTTREREAAREGPAVRRARRQRRRHRERRGPRDERRCDIVNEVGGTPANFLDIGGGADAEVLANAIEVINNDPTVRVDLRQHLRRHHARATKSRTASCRRSGASTITSPIVIRLDGTNAERGPRDPQAARVRPTRSPNPRWSTPRARPSSWREEETQ